MTAPMTSLKDLNSWQPRPIGGIGWYWMRHRRKWGRRWWFDVVWSGKDLKEVRLNGNWLPIERFNRVSFFGPMEPPEGAPG